MGAGSIWRACWCASWAAAASESSGSPAKDSVLGTERRVAEGRGTGTVAVGLLTKGGGVAESK
jgi:hypothetical protein